LKILDRDELTLNEAKKKKTKPSLQDEVIQEKREKKRRISDSKEEKYRTFSRKDKGFCKMFFSSSHSLSLSLRV
jgi:hypothetical protein